MPTYICVRCKQAIPPDDVHRDANGQTYDSGCFQTLAGVAAGPGLVITDIRVPFSSLFTIVSQVIGVIALWSLVGWLVATCFHTVTQ